MRLICLIALMIVLAACSGGGGSTDPAPGPAPPPPPTPSGNRMLGLGIIEGAGESFQAATDAAKQAGVEYVELTLAWNAIETAPGVFAPDPDFATIADGFYPAQNIGIKLSIVTLDTVGDLRPDWHKALAWDDPALIDAAWAMISRTLDAMPSTQFVGISIGNEVDSPLSGQTIIQNEFINFVRAIEQRLQTRLPSVPVGVKMTFGGLTGSERDFIMRLNNETDVVMLTYYPLNADFTPRSPDVASADFATMVSSFPGREIFLAEIGYQSSANCGSSEAAQASFVTNAFAAWDEHDTAITRMLWNWQTDITQAALDNYETIFGISDVCFLEYLGTLGLRNQDASIKPGWTRFVSEGTVRGFGN